MERSSKRAEPAWLGGAGAMMAVTITHPIDQTKIRMQTQRVKLGMVDTMRGTITREGFLGLWAGLTGSYVRQATYGVARFGIYRTLNKRAQARLDATRGDTSSTVIQPVEAISPSPSRLKIPKSTMVLNGAIAGVVAGIVGAPGELIMVRMSADAVRPVEKRYGYSNALQGLWRIARTEGVGSTFRGVQATVLRAVIMNASQLSCYDIIKEQLLLSGYFGDSIPTHLLTAVLGGTISVTLVAPVDFVKSRIQASSTQHPASQLFLQAIKREGPRVMFRGWLPAWWRMAPTTALTFAFYEQLKKLFV